MKATQERIHCKERVHNSGRTVTFHQCRFWATRDGYCARHHPDAVRAREKLRSQRYEQRLRNDPLRLALERIKVLEREIRRLKRAKQP